MKKKGIKRILKKSASNVVKNYIWFITASLPIFNILIKRTEEEKLKIQYKTIIMNLAEQNRLIISGMQAFMGIKKEKKKLVYNALIAPYLVNFVYAIIRGFSNDSWGRQKVNIIYFLILFIYQIIFELTQYNDEEKKDMLTEERKWPMVITIVSLAVLSRQ
jgi:uncharacterized membrane protein YbjE (DUF340 family)